MDVRIVDKYDDATLRAVNSLFSQLSSSARLINSETLKRIIESDSSHLFLAMDTRETVGMLTLIVFHVPSGIRARIEDVVVDKDMRGKGIASTLIASAIEHAGGLKAKTVDLTSRPARATASTLYQKMGFCRRDTNVFRFEIE